MEYFYEYDTILGRMVIVEEDNYITKLFVITDGYVGDLKQETPLIKDTYNQIEEYFKGKRKSFDIPLKPNGTNFQRSVWNALLKIPFGQTVTYKEIAIMVGNDKACRAVGNANNKNPIMIVIPCHRVIGSNQKLVGYALGIEMKEQLLSLEYKFSN